MKNNADIDYFDVDSLLTQDEQDFRVSVRRFVDSECMPVIAEHFDKGVFPMHLVPRLAEMGLFGLHVDGYGCRKRSHTLYGLISRNWADATAVSGPCFPFRTLWSCSPSTLSAQRNSANDGSREWREGKFSVASGCRSPISGRTPTG